MTQAVPAALVAPTRPGLTDVGYLVRSAANYSTILTNWTAVAEAGSSTGYYPVQGTISVPDAGCLIEFRRASDSGTFLSAVTVDPVQDLSTLALEATAQDIKAKTDALPSDPADQSLLIDAINTRASQTSVNALPTTAAPTAAQVATAVEAALLLESDGQALLTAIRETVATLFDSGADLSVITLVDAIADKITADHGEGSYLTPNLSALALEATTQAIKAKTDTISGQGLTQAEKDKLNELWQRAGLDLTNPVTRVQTGAVVTETFGAVEIEISNTTPNTVTSTRQPNA